jgi:murein DD-endopeptidase MepM/ murein hydrolase activator NlpD
MRGACLALGILWAACAAAETLYRLPWADGRSFMLTQVAGGRITTHFTKATLHAVDIAMPVGVPVVAARGGVVEGLEQDHGASAEEEPLTYEGNFVRVRHADGTAATYAHLAHRGVAVAVGDAVSTGQLLGYSGATGDAHEPHLHFVVTRRLKNSAGWQEEISVPVTFYVGAPPIAFAPRPALQVTARYSGAAEAPRVPSESRIVPWPRRSLEEGDEARAWMLLALWLAAGVAGLAWFWQFAAK